MSYSIPIPTSYPNYPISTSQYTGEPTYQFYIEFDGQGAAAFLGQISAEQAATFKGRSPEELSKTVVPSVCDDGPFGLRSDIPAWARQLDHDDHNGIDLSKPFHMTVTDDGGNIIFVNDGREYRMEEEPNIDDGSNYDDDGCYLYAKDSFPCSFRFAVQSSEPFDPMLLKLGCIDVMDSRIFSTLEYDGEEVPLQVLEWLYPDPDLRQVNVLYH